MHVCTKSPSRVRWWLSLLNYTILTLLNYHVCTKSPSRARVRGWLTFENLSFVWLLRICPSILSLYLSVIFFHRKFKSCVFNCFCSSISKGWLTLYVMMWHCMMTWHWVVCVFCSRISKGWLLLKSHKRCSIRFEVASSWVKSVWCSWVKKLPHKRCSIRFEVASYNLKLLDTW